MFTSTLVNRRSSGETERMRLTAQDDRVTGPRAFEAAVPAGEDPRAYANLLQQIREATISGQRPPAAPRALVDDSWRRTRSFGMDPDHGPELKPGIDAAEVESRRHTGKLARVLPILGDVLLPAAEDAGHVMVVVDAGGVVLWQDGPQKIRRHAERLGFAVGADWTEKSVGTNAIGTALVLRRPVQIYSAEHYVRSHHTWTCAAAPILDPANGELLGVVDVSGAASTVHPSTLALVDAAARVAESHLRETHQASLNALRANAAPLLSGVRAPMLVTDVDGWVAAASGVRATERIALPTSCDNDRIWLPAYGSCRLEPVPGGWLIRVLGEASASANESTTVTTHIELDVSRAGSPTMTIDSPAGSWTHRLSPRHAEILLVLSEYPDGASAAELSTDLFGSADHTVSVRAETSRLRKHLGGLLLHRPYRFADWVQFTVRHPSEAHQLLPTSIAPAVRKLRVELNQPETS